MKADMLPDLYPDKNVAGGREPCGHSTIVHASEAVSFLQLVLPDEANRNTAQPLHSLPSLQHDTGPLAPAEEMTTKQPKNHEE
jgi:hypothetical protein